MVLGILLWEGWYFVETDKLAIEFGFNWHGSRYKSPFHRNRDEKR